MSIFEPVIPIQIDMLLFATKQEEMEAPQEEVAEPACRYDKQEILD
jgi:hypothetical protein